MKYSFVTLLSLFLVETGYSWGDLGHETVGYVAMQFLAPNALDFVQQTLSETYDSTLGGSAATWADSIKYKHGYTFSKPFHFVDARDDPPTSCSVSETRDCANGNCILTAIANYTSRVVDTSLSSTQIEQALLFLDHFFGDIGQPLHVEYYKEGGNEIRVTCSGKKTELHAVWDTGMIEEYLRNTFDSSSENWAESLVQRIQSGDYNSSASSSDWLACSSPTETSQLSTDQSIQTDVQVHLTSRGAEPLICPLIWAREANAYDCSYVFSYIDYDDLCDSDSGYYTNAVPIIELQLAKQGFRLAAWLNALFDESTNLP